MRRILFMSFISYGLYFFYWFYITCKQYRDHTGEVAYPFWHTMTLTVPIYQFFRVHAHMRVFRELMTRQDLVTTISPGWAVVAFLIYDIEAQLDYNALLGIPAMGIVSIGLIT